MRMIDDLRLSGGRKLDALEVELKSAYPSVVDVIGLDPCLRACLMTRGEIKPPSNNICNKEKDKKRRGKMSNS